MRKPVDILSAFCRTIQNLSGVGDMCSGSYEEAVRTLNKLQSNAAHIRAAASNRRHDASVNTSLEDTREYLLRTGVTLDKLDSLQIIHVAGTKGKGSTCAFTESILRHHGYLTGFYSSPHLISVRERFRINGQLINESTFTHFFWKIYKLLDSKKNHKEDMPQYFKFLTIMMFHIFLEAKVNVAILEVGIGGQYDCTNIIENPVCIGITSLGLDHTSILGNTIEEIALQKSGIFKTNSPAFTVPQPIRALEVLEKRAIERNCFLSIVPRLESYKWPDGIPNLRIPLSVQEYNLSLAIQLASCWKRSTQKEEIEIERMNDFQSIIRKISVPQTEIETFHTHEKTELGILNCKWPGRTQILKGQNTDFFIDGAHTVESIELCSAWFKESIKNQTGKKYLIFNSTGDRDPEKLLAPLKTLIFDCVFFSPNIAGNKQLVDQENHWIGSDQQRERCERHLDIWEGSGVLVENVSEALDRIGQIRDQQENSISRTRDKVLITGSLHLVGAALSILDPELSMTTKFRN